MIGGGWWGGLVMMLAPFVMCLVLTGIHGYLGIHILSRKVIFVDLALAQIAALGTTFAFVLGYDAAHHGEDAPVVYWFSLGFTLLGAAVFAITRMRNERVPQEAFIGIIYASASAIAILMLSKAPGEGEHIKQMLVGNILLVRWTTIWKTAGIYAAIGFFHYLFRRQFFLISLEPERAEREGYRVRWWDFLFYASFGVVITSSVAVAGVLLVFTYLVVPAACAVLLSEGIRARIILAWGIGLVTSLAGILLSYVADLPTGPAVVGAFTVMLVLLGTGIYVVRSPAPLRALIQTVISALLVFVFLVGLSSLRKGEVPTHEHAGDFEEYMAALDDPDENRQIEAIHHLMDTGDPHALEKFLEMLPATPCESPVFEHLIGGLERLGDAKATDSLLQISERPDLDSLLKVRAASAVLCLRDHRGLGVLISILTDREEPLFSREEAFRSLRQYTGRDFGYLPGREDEENRNAIQKWETWWEGGKNWIYWRENLKRFQ